VPIQPRVEATKRTRRTRLAALHYEQFLRLASLTGTCIWMGESDNGSVSAMKHQSRQLDE